MMITWIRTVTCEELHKLRGPPARNWIKKMDFSLKDFTNLDALHGGGLGSDTRTS
jgi:hypothetical protein